MDVELFSTNGRYTQDKVIAEAITSQLTAAGIAPEAQHVAAAEVAEPRIVQEDHRVLLLHRRVRDPEVERVLVGRPLEPEPRGLGERLRGGDVAIGPDQDDIALRRFIPVPSRRSPHGKILRGDARVGVAVAARLDELLGRAGARAGDPVPGHLHVSPPRARDRTRPHSRRPRTRPPG